MGSFQRASLYWEDGVRSESSCVVCSVEVTISKSVLSNGAHSSIYLRASTSQGQDRVIRVNMKASRGLDSELASVTSTGMLSGLFQNYYLNFDDGDWPSHLESMSLDEDCSIASLNVALSASVWDGYFHHANASSSIPSSTSSSSSSSSSPFDWDPAAVVLAGTDQPWASGSIIQNLVTSSADTIPNGDASHPWTSDLASDATLPLCSPVSAVLEDPPADTEQGPLFTDRVSRRKRQNRASQRRFRANKEAKLKDSQERIRLLEAHLDIQRKRNVMLEQEWSRMKVEIERLTVASGRN